MVACDYSPIRPTWTSERRPTRTRGATACVATRPTSCGGPSRRPGPERSLTDSGPSLPAAPPGEAGFAGRSRGARRRVSLLLAENRHGSRGARAGFSAGTAGRERALDGLLAIVVRHGPLEAQRLQVALLENLERVDHPDRGGDHDDPADQREDRVSRVPHAVRPGRGEPRQKREAR